MSFNDNHHAHNLQHMIGILDCLLDHPAVELLSGERLSGNMEEDYDTDDCETVLWGALCNVAANVDEEGLRPKSFLHDEMNEFNQIFAELVHPKRHSSSKCLSSVDDLMSSDTVMNAARIDCDMTSCNKCCRGLGKTIALATSHLPDMKCHTTAQSFDQCHEDDNDSGYQSGNNTLVASVNTAAFTRLQPPPGSLHCVMAASKLMSDCYIDQGFIRVGMNLNNPISMALKSVVDFSSNNFTDVESFYLPTDTIIVIHITSKMTTVEVIQTLLDKYAITDNCKKFALYEKTINDTDEFGGQQCRETLRRLRSDERPLELWLHWTEDIDSHQFVLRDNVTSEIAWDAFSVPELEAFLHILDHEESAYITKITQKFVSLKTAIVHRLKQQYI